MTSPAASLPAITIQELLDWNVEAALFWKTCLDANPALLELPCEIAGSTNVLGFVRHIWGAELIWSQRVAKLPQMNKDDWPDGPLNELYNLHLEAIKNLRSILANPNVKWEECIEFDYPWLPPSARRSTPRKMLANTLLHSHRHYAQLATLVRAAGHPSGFTGDLMHSGALL
jgi:uncharacterized damage-inducible protein DinB